MSQLDTFIKANQADMLTDLRAIVQDCQQQLTIDAEGFDPGDTLHIDIRLCIDTDRLSDEPDRPISWSFLTGDASYDQRHSTYCGASCITLDTEPSELLNELLNDMND